MQTMTLLQGLIHKLETNWGLRSVKFLVLGLIFLALLIRYDVHCYQNMAAPAAMDAAQLARNIAQGRGYTTKSVRPLSIFLLKRKNHDASDKDPARLSAGHPDIANPPVYPVLLAGLMKVLPFQFDAGYKGKGSFWSIPDTKIPGGRRGSRYQPDFLIAVFNQFLFLVVLGLVFLWARRLFDLGVAQLSVFLLLGSEVLWRFTVSGLSTMLLMLIFVGLIWCLTLWESETREPKWGQTGLVFLSLMAGALAGVGGLTRYAFMGMILPVVIFLVVYGGPRRLLYCAAAIGAFVLVMAPWIARNYAVSGTPLGTASYSVIESFLPGFRLQRSLQPDLPHFSLIWYWRKFTTNLMPVLQTDLFKMTGGWIAAFFAVGLMVGFRNQALIRLRYFVVGCAITLVVTEALVRTQLTEETPEINSENLIVLMAPMVMVYGVALFYVLLDGVKFSFYQLRYVMIAVFAALLLLPMMFTLVSTSKGPLSFPPYRPDYIQGVSRLMAADEMMMSDVPWAVAWYGDRQCVWLTLNATANPQNPIEWQESFLAINDGLKPVHALYLTPRTLDGRFQSQWLHGGELSWGRFIAGTLFNGQVPPAFPLTKMPPPGYLPEQLLLSDWARW